MTTRRVSSAVLGTVLLVLAGASTALPASAQAANQVPAPGPATTWTPPDPNVVNVDGVGTWAYVAPQAPPGATQLSPGNYQYLLQFVFGVPRTRVGDIGLTTGPQGKVARLSLYPDTITGAGAASAEVAYNWSPGRFYFLYVHHLSGNDWGGWVMDWASGTWAYVGSVRTPADWGSMTKNSRTVVQWADTGGRPTDCSGFPLTDAYLYPPLTYIGESYTVSTLLFQSAVPGDCPSATEMLANGWVHYRVGAGPIG
jgi:hypothetical protein